MDIYGHIRTYLNIYGHVWTYIDIYGHIWTYIWGVNPPPRGVCACRRRFFFLLKNDAPGIFEHVFCEFNRFAWI